jgi:hypothetical protein
MTVDQIDQEARVEIDQSHARRSASMAASISSAERHYPAGSVPRTPAIRLTPRQPGAARRLRDTPALLCDAFNQEGSALRRQPRILVDVHLGLRRGLPMVGNQQFPRPTPDEQPM